MIKCPMCGAENRGDVDVCRMCASPLGAAGAATQVVAPASAATVATTIQPVPFINCPVCQTSNDADWDFCQQCGSSLKSKPRVSDSTEAATQVAMTATPAPEAKPEGPKESAQPEHCLKCGAELPPGSSFCSKCGAAAPIARTVVMTSAPKAVSARLVLVMEGDQRGEAYDLKNDTLIGRNAGQITFPHDEFMSGHHARIVRKDNKFVLSDEGSRNGTFIRITAPVELKPGDIILIGKQLFRLEV